MRSRRNRSVSPTERGQRGPSPPGRPVLRRLAPATATRTATTTTASALASASASASLPAVALIVNRRSRKVCRISQCHQPDCQLRSHIQYQNDQDQDRALRRVTSASTAARATVISTSTSSASVPTLSPTSADQPPPSEDDDYPPLIYAGVDGLPALPLEDGQAAYGELFHHFYSYQYDRIAHLVSPRPVTPLQRRRYLTAKRASLGTALSESVFYLHHCAASHHQLVFRPDGRCPNQTTASIRHNLMKLLRHKLNELEFKTSRAADVVLVILTLVMFETSSGDFSALAFHRQAMQHLVKLHGGVHNLDRYMPYVLVLDRLIALFSDLPPVLNSCPDRAIRRPLRHPCVYGDFFEPSETVPSGDPNVKAVNDYCFDVCRAIEMMEAEGLTFVPSMDDGGHGERGEHSEQSGHGAHGERHSPDSHYFYFIKESLATSFVHLNATLVSTPDLAQCTTRLLLLGSKIIEYSVLQDCYMVSIPLRLADAAKGIVEELDQRQHDSDAGWGGQDADLVRWILFTMCAMPVVWHGRRWALQQLASMLSFAYGGAPGTTATVRYNDRGVEVAEGTPDRDITGSWPSSWVHREHENVRRFVWSNTHLDRGFVAACDALLAGEPANGRASCSYDSYDTMARTQTQRSSMWIE